jgi:hypothetical protein
MTWCSINYLVLLVCIYVFIYVYTHYIYKNLFSQLLSPTIELVVVQLSSKCFAYYACLFAICFDRGGGTWKTCTFINFLPHCSSLGGMGLLLECLLILFCTPLLPLYIPDSHHSQETISICIFQDFLAYCRKLRDMTE